MMAGMTTIVRTISRLLFPFMLLFGIYVILHGHLTPGGGFQGGVIIAASFVMLWLAYSLERPPVEFRLFRTEVLESIGGLILMAIGLMGFAVGIGFFAHALPLGNVGSLFSGSDLPLLNIGTSISVASGMILVFYAMLRKTEVDT